MKTNKENTKNVIIGKYGRSTKNSVLNEFDHEYFVHTVEVTSVNDKKLYNYIHGRSKALSVAKGLIATIVNIDLNYECYNTVCTYNQIRNILKDQFNYNIEDLENDIVTFIENEREEMNS